MKTMKTIYYYSSAFVLALAMTACSDNEVIESIPSVETSGQVVRAIASTGSDTRMAIDDDGTQINFTWDASDKFTVFNGTQATEFVIEDGAGEAGATFVGKPAVAYKDNEILYAVYNKNANSANGYSLDADGNMTIDLRDQNGQLSDKYQYLFAESTYDAASGNVSFIFDNLVTVLKVNVELPDGVTKLDSLKLCSNNTLLGKASLVLSSPVQGPYGTHGAGSLISEGYEMSNYDPTNEITVRNVSVNGNIATAYFYVLPVSRLYFYDKGNSYDGWEDNTYFRPEFIAYSGNDSYVSVKNLNNRGIESGKTYKLTTDLFKLEKFANEDKADGWKTPYEIATSGQMYSFMLRAKSNALNEYGREYRRCNYILTDDIDLDKDIEWTPTNYDEAIFDGNGKTISGKLVFGRNNGSGIGLFYDMDVSTVKNLTVSYDICDKAPEYSKNRAGMIADVAWSSTFENCKVVGTLDSRRAKDVGGLVGISYSSKFIGCSSLGVIKNDTRGIYYGDNYISMGAIVGTAREDTQVIGCYSTAKFEVAGISNEVSYHAGIVGYVPEDYSRVKVLGCWASVPMTIDELSTDHILYFGGIGGYFNSGTIQNCYWDDDIATYVTCDTKSTIIDCESFVGNRPTSAQIAAMNNAILPYGCKYEDDGTVKPYRATTIDPFETEKW